MASDRGNVRYAAASQLPARPVAGVQPKPYKARMKALVVAIIGLLALASRPASAGVGAELSPSGLRNERQVAVTYGPLKMFEGVWLSGQEQSDFFRREGHGIDFAHSAWLDFEHVAGVKPDAESPASWGAYRIRFMGRQVVRKPVPSTGGYGHMGLWSAEIRVERIVSLSRAPEAEAEVRARGRAARLQQDDEVLEAAIRVFLGQTKNVNSQDEGTVADQVIEHLALPDQPFSTAVGEGFRIISGSLPHAAQTKGAALVDSSGQVRAAALLEFTGDVDHPDTYEAWVYVEGGPNADALVRRMRLWKALKPNVPIKVTRLPAHVP